MDTLSSSHSTFTLQTFISTTSRELSYLNNNTHTSSSSTTTTTTLLPKSQYFGSSTTSYKPTPLLHKHKTPPSCNAFKKSNNNNNNLPFLPSFQSPPRNHSSSRLHCEAPTGYAAALLDVAQSNGFVELLEKDVRRLSRLLANEQVKSILSDPLMGEKERGEIVKEMAETGRFEKHLVGLIKVLVEKNRVGILNDVLVEFQRIYDELVGTQLVLVPSGLKMETRDLFGIAKRVQMVTGASKVKVKRVADERLLSSVTSTFFSG